MVSVFFAFIINGDPTVKQFGVGMGVAVAVDATVVRCLLVPAVMVLVGKANWWFPRWLDRLVPNFSIEGDGSSNARPALYMLVVEAVGGRLHPPAAGDPADLRRQQHAARERDVLDHAVAELQVELAVGERQRPRGASAHTNGQGIGLRPHVDAGDVERRCPRPQPCRSAADVDDAQIRRSLADLQQPAVRRSRARPAAEEAIQVATAFAGRVHSGIGSTG